MFPSFFSSVIGIRVRYASFSLIYGYAPTAEIDWSENEFEVLYILTFFILSLFVITVEIAQLGERQTEDLKVTDSNPENSHEF